MTPASASSRRTTRRRSISVRPDRRRRPIPRTSGSRSASRSSAAVPPGSPAPIKLMQTARGRAGADRAARRGAGGGDREGQGLRRAHAERREHASRRRCGSCSRTSTRRTGRSSTRRSTKDAVYLLTKKAALPLKPMPPNFRNHGNYVTSVSKLSPLPRRAGGGEGRLHPHRDGRRQAAGRGPASSAASAPATAAAARTARQLGNFEPGSDVVAKATVLAEGTLGHLTQARDRLLRPRTASCRSAGSSASRRSGRSRSRSTGSSTRWAGRCASGAKYNEFGGSFIYPMGEDKLCIGMVIGLDYTDATLSCHDLLQEFKTHPFVEEDARGRQARRLGREDDPLGRLLLDAAKPHGARAW